MTANACYCCFNAIFSASSSIFKLLAVSEKENAGALEKLKERLVYRYNLETTVDVMDTQLQPERMLY